MKSSVWASHCWVFIPSYFFISKLCEFVIGNSWRIMGASFFPPTFHIFFHSLVIFHYLLNNNESPLFGLSILTFFYNHYWIWFFFGYKIEILLYPNLSVYVCETPFWKLEPHIFPPTSHKHSYLWSDHRTKGVRWWFDYLIL